MAKGHILGFPRIGAQRELKFALESFWRGESDENHLKTVGAKLRQRHWQLQVDAGLDFVSVGDFAYYDQMLTQTALLGALPKRFAFGQGPVQLAELFAAARGTSTQPAMEMTKWFDTNYHYIVPELSPETRFAPSASFLIEEVDEALKLGFNPKPVLIGPVSYLYLSKSPVAGFDRLSLLCDLIEAFTQLLLELAVRGIEWVQIDEPALGLDLDPSWLAAYQSYSAFSACGVKLLLATYFESVADKIDLITTLPLHGVHIDLIRAPEQLDPFLTQLPDDWVLSAGIIDGRNIWRTDLSSVLSELAPASVQLGEKLWVAPSSSLLHCPVGLNSERLIDSEIKSWLAFATEKLTELASIACGLTEGNDAIAARLAASDLAAASRKRSKRVANQLVQRHLAQVTDAMAQRNSDFDTRIGLQQQILHLPLLPTTTIGSFPQTPSIRQTRAAFKRGELSALDYLERMREEIEVAVRRQEQLGLDVLVHGEAERNDMVEYFGEQLWGYAFTEFGWVQSYGSRCVKPPIIYGDIYRPVPMTVETTVYAQSLTDRPMKGMLTGPVTMLQWSFVRDDQPRATTALQLALAIRSEVRDLEQAGIRVIQIDEPALREGLPLRKRDWDAYLAWATRAFRISSSGIADTTQIHTHMCYAEFNDILPAIAAMDADVITIETSRSAMELLDGFAAFAYPNEIGPGVYDIHSPRIPSQDAIEQLLRRACEVIPIERLWVNPDCGLKTRGWSETEAALRNMVAAAKALRARHARAQGAKEQAA